MSRPNASLGCLDAFIEGQWGISATTVLVDMGCAALMQQDHPPKLVLDALVSISLNTPNAYSSALETLKAVAAPYYFWKDWGHVETTLAATLHVLQKDQDVKFLVDRIAALEQETARKNRQIEFQNERIAELETQLREAQAAANLEQIMVADMIADMSRQLARVRGQGFRVASAIIDDHFPPRILDQLRHMDWQDGRTGSFITRVELDHLLHLLPPAIHVELKELLQAHMDATRIFQSYSDGDGDDD
ncbi:uncharacterized protein BKCO1_9000145 [Diplodia corticola]|uniref:Uncharacterized protein n=1 Tax=Diplodia corticola TaxID=236234 RepID=A0A1J9R9Q9_9PEZI|nr:uncharacterized protein BKCO1_9000145 [Diplodia corticola]OJD36914.1 hypothetical protein BKCO1_9000145 [Diplodia corticola]